MGAPGMDIKLSEKARDYFPFAIECKNQESLNIWQMMEQAEKNSKIIPVTLYGQKIGEYRELVPLGIFKRNKSKIYCTMAFDDLLLLMRAFHFGK